MNKKYNNDLLEIIAKKNNEILELNNEIAELKKCRTITSILLPDKKEILKS